MKAFRGWKRSSVIEGLSTMCEVLSTIPRTTYINKQINKSFMNNTPLPTQVRERACLRHLILNQQTRGLTVGKKWLSLSSTFAHTVCFLPYPRPVPELSFNASSDKGNPAWVWAGMLMKYLSHNGNLQFFDVVYLNWLCTRLRSHEFHSQVNLKACLGFQETKPEMFLTVY